MKYIAYSLFGSDRRYLDGLQEAVAACRHLYPEWSVLVYYEQCIAEEWIEMLALLDIELVASVSVSRWDGLYWRFQVLDRADCEMALIRDADSPPTTREAKMVKEWMQSDHQLHIIRDHPNHSWPINAGMWGIRNPDFQDFSALIRKWKWKAAKSGDQHFLRRKVYNRYYRKALIHTPFVGYQGENVIRTEPSADFIGKPFFSDLLEDFLAREYMLFPRKSVWGELRLEYDFYRRRAKRLLGIS